MAVQPSRKIPPSDSDITSVVVLTCNFLKTISDRAAAPGVLSACIRLRKILRNLPKSAFKK